MVSPQGGLSPPRRQFRHPGGGVTLGEDPHGSVSLAVDGGEQGVVDEVGVVGVAFDVRAHERAQGNDRADGRPFGVEGSRNQRRRHSLTLTLFIDLGVHEDRPAAVPHVFGVAPMTSPPSVASYRFSAWLSSTVIPSLSGPLP